MNKYELLYIIDNELEAEAKDALIAKFSDIVVNDGGSVETIDKWGTKKLAYPINFKNEGFYVLMNFTEKPVVPAEISIFMHFTDAIMRHLIVKK